MTTPRTVATPASIDAGPPGAGQGNRLGALEPAARLRVVAEDDLAGAGDQAKPRVGGNGLLAEALEPGAHGVDLATALVGQAHRGQEMGDERRVTRFDRVLDRLEGVLVDDAGGVRLGRAVWWGGRAAVRRELACGRRAMGRVSMIGPVARAFEIGWSARRAFARALVGALGVVLGCVVLPAAALGADSVYWGNFAGANQLSFVSLDATAGGDLTISGATVNQPLGVAIDAGAGRIYWANDGTYTISFANLDGSGGGDLTTTGATIEQPEGVAVDPAAPGGGRIYWANLTGGKISFANLDGSGGGDVTTAGATVSAPGGVTVDPAAPRGGRIYWANSGVGKISFANLDGSGGGDLNTSGATVNQPFGVAVDPGRPVAGGSTGPTSGGPTSRRAGSRSPTSTGVGAAT